MNKIKTDRTMPIGKLTKIFDFLPPPEQLAIPSETIKITIALNKSSIDLFRSYAKRHQTKYQKMIREVIDRYASHYFQR